MKFLKITNDTIDAIQYLGNHFDLLKFAEDRKLDTLRFDSDTLFLITEKDDNGLTLHCVTVPIGTWLVFENGALSIVDDFHSKYVAVP